MSSGPTIQNIPSKQLVEAADNPNVMPEGDFKSLVAAINAKGFLQPILVRALSKKEFRVIDGHHRLRASRELKMQEVPCVVAEVDDAGEVILRIAMNKLRGELDLTSTGRILKEFVDDGWALDAFTLTGFSESELTDLLASVSQSVDTPMELEVPKVDYEVEEDTTGLGKTFELKVVFETREDLKKAKQGLKRAGGKTKDMAVGLLKLLGQEKTKQAKEAAA